MLLDANFWRSCKRNYVVFVLFVVFICQFVAFYPVSACFLEIIFMF